MSPGFATQRHSGSISDSLWERQMWNKFSIRFVKEVTVLFVFLSLSFPANLSVLTSIFRSSLFTDWNQNCFQYSLLFRSIEKNEAIIVRVEWFWRSRLIVFRRMTCGGRRRRDSSRRHRCAAKGRRLKYLRFERVYKEQNDIDWHIHNSINRNLFSLCVAGEKG